MGTSPSGATNVGSSTTGSGLDIKKEDDGFMVGSPMKRQRASVAEFDADIKTRLGRDVANSSGAIGKIMGPAEQTQPSTTDLNPTGLQFGGALSKPSVDDDEEL